MIPLRNCALSQLQQFLPAKLLSSAQGRREVVNDQSESSAESGKCLLLDVGTTSDYQERDSEFLLYVSHPH